MVFKALKDIAHITMGQSPESESYNDERVGIPFFQGNADFGEIYPNNRIWCSSPKKIAEPGDILISVRAPIGALNYAKERCCIGRGLAAISIKDEAERNYVFHLLKAKNKELNSKGTGSTFKAIGKNVLEEVLVPQISPKEQQKRMSIMDYLESIIRKRREQLLFLDKLIKARFVEMFEGNFPSVKLGDVIKTTSGGTPLKTHKEYYDNGTIPWLTSGEINAGVITKVKNFITEEGLNHSSAKIVPMNTVVIAMYGATAGVTGILRLETTTNQAVCSLLPSDRFIPEFLYYAVSAKKDWMISQCQGGGQPNISQGIIKSMNLIDAPKEEQIKFSDFAKQIDKSKFNVNCRNLYSLCIRKVRGTLWP